jgi:hypothetical protein
MAPHTHPRHPLIPSSIGGRVGEWSPSKTDTVFTSVENSVKPLQECHAAEEAQAGIHIYNVLYGQVDGVCIALYGGIVLAPPDLSVRSQFECLVVDVKVERLEVLVLRLGNAEEVSLTIQYPASGFGVLVICV